MYSVVLQTKLDSIFIISINILLNEIIIFCHCALEEWYNHANVVYSKLDI